MPQPGHQTTLIYSSLTPGATPPAATLVTNISGAELALNAADGKLFFKDTNGNVRILADVNIQGAQGVANITGGSINNTTIGDAVPSTGRFTTLVAGALTLPSIVGILKSSGNGGLSAAIPGYDYVSGSMVGIANGVPSLDANGKVPLSQLPDMGTGSLVYLGTWNAATNQPNLTSGVGVKGQFYKVNVAGNTDIDGETTWLVGDQIVFSGTKWERVTESTAPVTSVNGMIGAVNITKEGLGAATAGSNFDITSLNGLTIPLSVAQGGTGGATFSGLVKAQGSNPMTSAVPGVDYAVPTTGTVSQLLGNNGSGGFNNVTLGSGLSLTGGVLSATAQGGGSGTVTNVQASGGTTGLNFTGGPITSSGILTLGGTLSVTNGGTGRANLSGILKGNGSSAIVPAIPGTDYAVPPNGGATQLIANNGSGGFTNVTIGSGLSLGGGVLTATGTGGGGNPGGGNGTVTSVNVAGGSTGLTFSGGPVTTAGTVTMGGVLSVSSGGTGTTSLTGMLKGNGVNGVTSAVVGVDYAPPTPPGFSRLLGSNGSGGFSSITVGNGLALTGTTLTATGGGGGTPNPSTSTKTKVVVVGGSITGQQPLFSQTWPLILEYNLKSSGADVDLYDFGINSWTYNRSNTVTRFGGQKTQRQMIIDAAPSLLIVALGFNDCIVNIEGRTLEQAKADATAFYTAIKAALPNCKIVYMSEESHDSAHAAPANLLNMHVMPCFWNLASSDITNGSYCFAAQLYPVDSARKTCFANWVQLDAHIKSLSQVDTWGTLPQFKAARLGLCANDGMHFKDAGAHFLAAAVRKMFDSNAVLKGMFPNVSYQDYGFFDDPQTLFDGILSDTGAGWTEKPGPWYSAILHSTTFFGPWIAHQASVWYFPSKPSFVTSNRNYQVGQPFTWLIQNAAPNTQVQTSLNGAAWVNAFTTTDGSGNFLDSGVLNVPAGNYQLLYKVGPEVYGPINMTVSGSSGGNTGGGGGSSHRRIVVLGDSLTAQQPLFSRPWPGIVEDNLRASGADVEVFNVAINGWTYARANSEACFGNKTMLQQAVGFNPDLVLVALGFNDTITGVGGRTLAQAKADATTFYTTLKQALPNCKVMYLSQVPFDNTNASPSNLLNMHIFPVFWTIPTTGILANAYTTEHLALQASSTVRSRAADWVSLDAHIKSLALVDAYDTFPIWKTCRMGLSGTDGLHFTQQGHYFLAAAVIKMFRTVPMLKSLYSGMSVQSLSFFDDPDTLFDGFLTNSSGQWESRDNVSLSYSHAATYFGPWIAELPFVWYYPMKPSVLTSNRTYLAGQVYTWMIRNASPYTQVQVSMNGGPWFNAHQKTDHRGDFLDSGVLTFPADGVYNFRYKVGAEIYGPFALTVTGTGGGGGASNAKAFGQLWGIAGAYSTTSNGFSPVYYSTAGATAVNGVTVLGQSGQFGPSLSVPRSGRYRIGASFLATAGSSAQTAIFIRVVANRNGAEVELADGSTTLNGGFSGAAMITNSTSVRDLVAGDRISVKVFTFNGYATHSNGSSSTGNWLTIEEM